MSAVRVAIKGMAVLVATQNGLVALMPIRDHHLEIDGTQYPPGARVTLEGATSTTVVWGDDAERLLVKLTDALDDPNIHVKRELLDAPVDSTLLNARIELGGGTVVGQKCSIKPWDEKTWWFSDVYTHWVTDNIVYECPVDPHATVRLMVNGVVVRTVKAGDSVTLENADDELGVGQAGQAFFEVDGFMDLCATHQVSATATSVESLKLTHEVLIEAAPVAGYHRICLIARGQL